MEEGIHYRFWSVWRTVAVGLALLLANCPIRVERAQSRAGVGIALGVRHTAQQVASTVANQPDDACGTYSIEGPITVEVQWSLSGPRLVGRPLSLEEARTLEVDERGRVRLVRTVAFEDETGRRSWRRREWRLVDTELYLKDHNLPFERRPADVTEVASLLTSATEVFETLIRVTDRGWTEVTAVDGGWSLAASANGRPGRRIRCGGEARSDPWLLDLMQRARVVEGWARIEVGVGSDRPRARRGEWQFELRDGDQIQGLHVQVDERMVAGPIANSIEPPEEVADLSRYRLYRRLEDFLADIDPVQ